MSTPTESAARSARSASPVAAGYTVVVYSPKAERRDAVLNAVGRRPAADVGRITWVECETFPEVLTAVERGNVDLAILDGEAQPTGGMGICRQMKFEIDDCPPVCVLIQRRDDRWLATWALADSILSYPLDPIAAAETVAEQLRQWAAGVPVIR